MPTTQKIKSDAQYHKLMPFVKYAHTRVRLNGKLFYFD
ncbi:MAG: Hypothetical protein AJITA_00074 [Acetilactobacillus jinshanensis]